nr:hypothetical protein [Tanacetum cinerariifolium]GEZ83200.1 hypothetical protein [Tanacetum cinerariifolium]
MYESISAYGPCFFHTPVIMNNQTYSDGDRAKAEDYYTKGLNSVILDVKFFENIFSFKDTDIEKIDTANVFQDINHIKFFDYEYPEMPNDDERVDPNQNCDNKSQNASRSSSESGRDANTADF